MGIVLNSWIRIGLCLVLLASASALAAQSRSDEFTIVVVPDVHAPNDPSQWVAVAKWIAANCPAWNCKAIVAVGDYVNNPSVANERLNFVAGYILDTSEHRSPDRTRRPAPGQKKFD